MWVEFAHSRFLVSRRISRSLPDRSGPAWASVAITHTGGLMYHGMHPRDAGQSSRPMTDWSRTLVQRHDRNHPVAYHDDHGDSGQRQRVCPWCGSTDTVYVQRGFIGPTDERNQYYTCNACDRLTYEIVSKTVRDMRLGQFRTGGIYRDTARQTKYEITRILKVGMNESLLYLKPIARHQSPFDERDH
jgi:hypothetical protein